jgi:decaprenyl-phosphate phosphoribosyltransferase
MGTSAPPSHTPTPDGRASLRDWIVLARPWQWAKGAFVLIGPVYGRVFTREGAVGAAAAFFAFALASSACYVVNDVLDREADRAHPRKRLRPIAAGRIAAGGACAYAVGLLALAGGAIAFLPVGSGLLGPRGLVGVCVGLYVANVLAYSAFLKNRMVADVISLSLGFVLRVLGGCAAVAVVPSPWLLNVTFFLSMFLAFGKRLGERRSLGSSAAAARIVHARYTDELLRMLVVVTGVAALLIYAVYVQDQASHYEYGFNLLWLTMLPATYGLMRAMVKVETGEYDDPTEMAMRDWPTQAAGVVFAGLTVALLVWRVRTEGHQ